MKKIICGILMLLAYQVMNVYALNKSESNNVTVGNVDVPVYNVETVWGNMDFTFLEQINYIWDENNHVYEIGPATYKWTSEDNYIIIKNNSNFDINVKFTYTSSIDNIAGSFDVNNTKINAHSQQQFNLTLNGQLNGVDNEHYKVGFISYKIS